MSAQKTISNSFTVTTMESPVSVQAQYAPNNNPSAGQIHNVWQDGDLYMRTRETDSNVWSSWHKIVGESGDETDFSFGISAYKTTANATTAPSDISSWSDAPLAVTSAKPYLWAKVQKKSWNASTQSYDVDSTTYIRLTGEDGSSVMAQYAPNNNPSSSQIHDTWQSGDLYMRTKSTTDSNWSSWHKIVGESGDETDYSFNISKSKTSTNSTTAPSDCYYTNWQDAPVAPTSTYPYMWMKIVKKTWNESTQSYDSGTPSYARVTGELGIDYEIRSTRDSVKIASDATTATCNATLSFYQKESGKTPVAYNCHYACYSRTGQTYTLFQNSSSKTSSATINPEVSAAVDAIAIFIFDSAYNGSSPTSQNYLAKYEIIVSKNGNTGQSTQGEDAQYIYLKGTGNNNPMSAVCKINNGTSIVERTNMTRGLTLILINRLTLEIYSQTSYDVYGDSVSAGETQCANLATAINNASSSYFVCVVSYDAVRWTNDLIAALQSCGSKGIDDTTAYRVPFAFIGYKGLPQGYGIQMQSGQGTNDAPAEVTAYVSNGALSTSKDPTAGRLGGRFYYDAGDFEYSSSLSFKVTASEAPYFFYDNNYWVFEPNVTSDTTYTTADMGYPSSTNSNWHLMMYNTQRFFMSDAIFGKYAHLGSAVINGDWIISSNGSVLGTNYTNDSYMTGKVIKASSTGDFKIKAYTLFETSNPLNDKYEMNSGSNITIGASAQTASMCQPYLTKGKVYKLTVVGRKNTSDSGVYIRIRNNSYGTYSAIYLATTSDYTYTATFQVETSGYYYIEMYQPTLPSSSSGGGVVTSYSLVRALFKTAYAVDLKMGISYQTQIYASGGLRSPFTFINEGSTLTSNFNDNSALYSYSSSWGSDSYYNLPWDISQSGRKICLTNYKWNGTEQATTGYCYLNAPSGKYFYEDGIRKSTLRLSREGVELLGFGDTNEFYGWIVVKRFDLVTDRRYGRNLKVLATGRVSVTSSGSVSVACHTFDGTSITCTRNSAGNYTLTFCDKWYQSSGHVLPILTPFGYSKNSSGNTSNPAIITHVDSTSTTITVLACDKDNNAVDASFNFIFTNFNDWLYIEPSIDNS